MSNKEYIDRKRLLEKMYKSHSMPIFIGHRTDEDIMYERMLQMVKQAPAADVVEVVRCKDCKHFYENNAICLKIYSDGNVSANAWQQRQLTDFCSYGERRVNNDT